LTTKNIFTWLNIGLLTQILVSSSSEDRRIGKGTLIELLRKNGTKDVEALESLDVTEENLIFFLRKEKYRVNELFFDDLADLLEMPRIQKNDLTNGKKLSTALPYGFLNENLIIPVEIGKKSAKFATANPLNTKALSVLKEIFHDKNVEFIVGSIDSIEDVIEDVYREIQGKRATWDLYYRAPDESAYEVLVPWQAFVISITIIALLTLFLISYPFSMVLVFVAVNIVYFLMNPFRYYIAYKGIRNRHRTTYVSDEDVKKLKDEELPIYTILVPLYKEAKVLPHIMDNINKMDYPKNRLDVKILLEEDDLETINEARRLGLFGNPEVQPKDITLAQYREFLKIFDIVVVPGAEVKTKPRACNYGLLRARGEYVVIYDAEDDPAPDQAKRAVIAFRRIGMRCACLQSHLNFYNPGDNLLTRWFSLEYSYWYDYYLEGLDTIGAPIPLGGTSNHFRTEQLRELGSWDPFNMTEDADLGIRIYRKGLKTAMLNSFTYEEANKELRNWVRQRSRWCKGHLQTYLVHMRHPRKILHKIGWKKFLLFQMTFGGNIILPLINPVLWGVTILTLISPGVFNFLLFANWITFISIFNLIGGNLIHILLYMSPALEKKQYSLVPLAITMPIYWLLLSLGAWRGVLQLLTKPHLWEKTTHGMSTVHRNVTV
jgi:cellulose synthase/poly-beta-1,6-N-acetylglucosamine synthase-like glycosyltransferase